MSLECSRRTSEGVAPNVRLIFLLFFLSSGASLPILGGGQWIPFQGFDFPVLEHIDADHQAVCLRFNTSACGATLTPGFPSSLRFGGTTHARARAENVRTVYCGAGRRFIFPPRRACLRPAVVCHFRWGLVARGPARHGTGRTRSTPALHSDRRALECCLARSGINTRV